MSKLNNLYSVLLMKSLVYLSASSPFFKHPVYFETNDSVGTPFKTKNSPKMTTSLPSIRNRLQNRNDGWVIFKGTYSMVRLTLRARSIASYCNLKWKMLPDVTFAFVDLMFLLSNSLTEIPPTFSSIFQKRVLCSSSLI